jgi:hypothetical protein
VACRGAGPGRDHDTDQTLVATTHNCGAAQRGGVGGGAQFVGCVVASGGAAAATNIRSRICFQVLPRAGQRAGVRQAAAQAPAGLEPCQGRDTAAAAVRALHCGRARAKEKIMLALVLG